MTTFLFWNIYKKSIANFVASLAQTHNADVIILAECKTPAEVLESLNSIGKVQYHLTKSECKRIYIYSRFSKSSMKTLTDYEDDLTTFRRLITPYGQDILLIAVHALSKLYEDNQALEHGKLSRKIREVEKQLGHLRTVLVGDLNVNPFEEIMISANGFHAVSSRQIARKGKRKVRGTHYPFFYNPMWGYFGDGEEKLSGTYYFNPSGRNYGLFWNVYDQVLIRPDLLNSFRNEDLKIVSEVNKKSFLKKEIPNKLISDHLPIVFSLNL